VLVPTSALTELCASQLEALLLHELAHIQRHDYLINLLQVAVESVLFYHPAAWWISSQIRRERENCCDDRAAMHCPSRIEYARALTAMEEARRGLSLSFVLGATGNGDLLRRVERLVGRSASSKAAPLFAPRGRSVCRTYRNCAGVSQSKNNGRRRATRHSTDNPSRDHQLQHHSDPKTSYPANPPITASAPMIFSQLRSLT